LQKVEKFSTQRHQEETWWWPGYRGSKHVVLH